jgi:hypothetical protein
VNGDDQDPDKLANRLEREADQLKRRSDELSDDVSEVRQDWERKRRDPGVPGADPPEGDKDDEAPSPEGDKDDEAPESSAANGADHSEVADRSPAQDEASREGKHPPDREAG